MAEIRTILHVDLDAFFVSCELLRRPELRDQPVVVAGGQESHPGSRGDSGRSVVAAASYEARQFGVHSALPLGRALGLCPELVVLPVDIGHYAANSKLVFRVFREITPLVEPGSLDEAFLDVSGSTFRLGAGEAIARSIQLRLQQELGLPSSVGVATTKVVAKVASDLRKPRGLVVVAPGQEAGFLAPLPVGRLPGAGPKTVARLHLLGVERLGQLVQASPQLLARVGIPNSSQLQQRAAGIDASPVEVPGDPKSISREETYSRDLTAQDELEARIRLLSAAVGQRLRQAGLGAGATSLKLRFSDFQTMLRRRRLVEPTTADLALAESATLLFRESWPLGRPVRLLGVGAESLGPQLQLSLFDGAEQEATRLDLAMDRLRGRFGPDAIVRGTQRLGSPRDWNRDHLPRGDDS